MAYMETGGMRRLACGIAEGYWWYTTIWLIVLLELINFGLLGDNWPEDTGLCQEKAGPKEPVSCSSRKLVFVTASSGGG